MPAQCWHEQHILRRFKPGLGGGARRFGRPDRRAWLPTGSHGQNRVRGVAGLQGRAGPGRERWSLGWLRRQPARGGPVLPQTLDLTER